MSARELDAAGITNPVLRASYEVCRRLNAKHGRTYYLATRLLPAAKRPYVHALYGFARHADEFVDSLTAPDPQALLSWSEEFLTELDSGASRDPIGAAMADTMHRWDIPRAHVVAFLDSMRRDITVNRYETYADLADYMYGSAAVIGLQMLPILEPIDTAAYRHAQALGEAFQLSNFIRDVGEDLHRGRVYLPQQDLRAFGVTVEDLRAGVVTEPLRDLLRFEIARARGLYAEAERGVELLHPSGRECIRTALVLYGGILDAVESADYQVLTQRVSVPLTRRLRVALPAWARARVSHRDADRWREVPA